jgi:ribosomal protein RSM22 (predicted rRNA methylase)
MKQSNTLLQRAVDVEDKFLESTIDKLGLELLHGDDRRKSWGRLIRAPLKKKGHVLVDYCSAGCGGGGGCSVSTTDYDDNGGTQGRITRQKISRGWSARAAPGCYSAARKARWGGLWPDMSERVKRIDKEEDDLKKRIISQNI